VPGTQAEAVIRSYGVNATHGLPRTLEEKREIVIRALANPDLEGFTVYQISKICRVSQSFVAGIKDPAKKEKQKAAKEKHIKKKAKELTEADASKTTSQTSSEKATPRETPNLNVGANPDEAEMRAAELAIQADQEVMYKLLESDDALATAHEEIKRLNLLNGQLEVRLYGLMNEKNEAVKLLKKLQKELDKLKAQK
jgi:hypothetical protein